MNTQQTIESDLKEKLNEVLQGLKINGKCIEARTHRHLAFLDIKLAPGTAIRKIEARTREIASELYAETAPIVKHIPKRGIVQLQIAMHQATAVPLHELLKDVFYVKDNCVPLRGTSVDISVGKKLLPFVLGETTSGEKLVIDMARNPHLLIAGGTGSGKSVLLHTIIANAAMMNKEGIRDIRMYLIDPKRVEFGVYKGKNKKLIVANTYDDALALLKELHAFMERRYVKMAEAGVKSVEERPNTTMHMVIIDEIGDLIIHDNSLPLGQRGEFQKYVNLLAQKCRGAGIYLVAATQHPSHKIIKGEIKANFPARIACRVTTKSASQVIIDEVGAENLMGRGDAIFKGAVQERFQVAFTDPDDTVARYMS